MPPPRVVSRDVARRYVLGRQGLWPGRRWTGRVGAAAALQALEAVQMDPLTVVARSHDHVLWSRVLGYTPADLDTLLYQERSFFDYGAHLDIYPIDELPMWRRHMQQRRADPRWIRFAAEHGAAIEQARAAIRERGPLSSRELEGQRAVSSYRGSKDSAVALYYLWLTGELVTHSRRGFDRVYDLRERLAPPDLDYVADESAALNYFAGKALRMAAPATASIWAAEVRYALHQPLARQTALAMLSDLVERGEAIALRIDNDRAQYFAPADDAPVLDELSEGRVPDVWTPLGSTTLEEVALLSPLDNAVHQRERTRAIFDFDYVWEIYKPAQLRRWGRYTLPVLFGDRLVARVEPRLDRRAGTLCVEQAWFEPDTPQNEPAFRQALHAGLMRFAAFLGARLVY